MPKISVSTVQFYAPGPDGRPMQKELRLSSVDKRFQDIRFPAKGRTFLYGHNNPGIHYLVGVAAITDSEGAITELSIEVENWLKHKVRLGDEPGRGVLSTRFLSIARGTKEVIDLIEEICGEEGSPMFGASGLVLEPERLDRLTEHESFKHLWVIAYSVNTAEVGVMQVATVFNFDAITEVATSPLLEDVDLVV